jgi:DNA repair protein RadA/Sms
MSEKLRAISGGKSPLFVCFVCHEETRQRATACPACGRLDTLVRQEEEAPEESDPGRPAKHAVKLSLRRPKFYSTGSEAWDTVLGGGFVKPSSCLVYGPRGVGKSTRALALGLHVAHLTRGKILYGSAEMPAEHVRLYAERIGVEKTALARLWVQDSTDALDLLANIDQERPTVVVWDSIQRFTWEGELGDVELRQVVHHALEATKHYKLISIFLSQVSKEDVFLGPNGIGHDVDVMVRLSRENGDLIVETPDKNRFAPTPMRASERFLAEPEERETVNESRLPLTIDEDQATREWLTSSKPHVPT